jgi:hypothetical protein
MRHKSKYGNMTSPWLIKLDHPSPPSHSSGVPGCIKNAGNYFLHSLLHQHLRFRYPSTHAHCQQLPSVLSASTRHLGHFLASGRARHSAQDKDGGLGLRDGLRESKRRPMVWETCQVCQEVNQRRLASRAFFPHLAATC